jgi:hypothetical protein
MGGWVGVKAALRIAYSNQKLANGKMQKIVGLGTAGWI